MPSNNGYAADGFIGGFMRGYDFVDKLDKDEAAAKRQKQLDEENRDYRNRTLAVQEAGTESAPFEAQDTKTGLTGYYTRNSRTGTLTGLAGIAPVPDKPKYGYQEVKSGDGTKTYQTVDGEITGDPIATGTRNAGASQAPYFAPVYSSQGVYGFNSRTGTAQPVFDSSGKPLIQGALDPATQGAVSAAKSTGAARGKYAGSQPKVLASLRDASAKTDQVTSAIDKALGMVNGWTTGVSGSVASHIPGTAAKDLQRTLDAVRANIGFGELQQMRANSPTGGALGAVSERENTLLQSVLGSLEQDQSPAQLKENLLKAKAAIADSRERLRQAYEADFGTAPAAGGGQTTASPRTEAQAAPSAPNVPQSGGKTAVRSGTLPDGRRVTQYDDGTTEIQ